MNPGEGGGGRNYVRDVVAPVAERAHQNLKRNVKVARCAIGRAGIATEAAGMAGSEVGLNIFGAGAALAIAGAVTFQPEVVAGGLVTAKVGAAFAAASGLTALTGAAMRAVGGDYRSALTRGAIHIASRAVPGLAGGRAIATNAANRVSSDKTKGVPACE